MSDNETIRILFCADGSQLKIDMSIEATLEELKEEISSHRAIEPENQRLFHLGREIKNSRRSLNALGIGRFGVFVVHLHTKKPLKEAKSSKRVKASSSSNGSMTNKEIDIEQGEGSRNLASSISTSTTAMSINNNSSSNASRRRRRRSNNAAVVVNTEGNTNGQKSTSSSSSSSSSSIQKNSEVVLLLDSDDDDDDFIEIVEAPSSPSTSKRRRRR